MGPIKQQPNIEINLEGLRKFVNYRNPQDDKVQLALQEGREEASGRMGSRS